ncbi:MAG TPA: ribosome-associated translation inhibitor RaiA [Methylocella sp.]|nr:ribosome-associated translation inhibitor RaiA [Methylocella sp.]
MTLRISGKNLDIGLAFRTHIETRIDSALAKYRTRFVAGHVTVEPEGSGFRADCTLHLSSGATLQADAKSHEPYASFNRAADLIENQIRRHRERLLDHHAGTAAGEKTMSGPLSPGEALEAKPETPLADSVEKVLQLHPAVIAEPSSGFKEMTVSGAAMELDSTNAHVVVFRHASDGRMNVVYRRPDGNIGWIDPGRN